MRIAYFDCMSGISGDMTLGALVDAGVDFEAIQQGVTSLGLPSCKLVATEVKKHGFRATKIDVEHEPEHTHRHLHHIVDMIDGSGLTEPQKDLARRIFTRLGEAEAKVHGSTLRKVHFHEVGAVDSIADIVGAAIGLNLLNVDRIACSPIPTGHGFIKIAHGRVSVPAPATAELLNDVPLAASDVEAELTTPTGAAIVTTVADQFGSLPPMRIETIGYGAGTKDLEGQANLLRLFVGNSEESADADQVWVLEANLDDTTGEIVGHCLDQLLDAGALDVYVTPIQMKKNRPGVKLSILCGGDHIKKLESIVFHETTTLGIRRWPASRHKLQRQTHTVQTQWGEVEGKLAMLPGARERFSPEFESCKRIADSKRIPLREVYDQAIQEYQKDGH